jgi:ABC-type branched-subunit amino acid transport system ATPase component
MLEVRGVTVDFHGLRAVDDASFRVDEGRIVGLIGPNGAGKTTLFNTVSGMNRPSAGQVLFEGRDLARLSPADRSRLGIGRTFQIVKPFGGLSVRDNVLVGALTRGQSVAEARRTAVATLERLNMGHLVDVRAASLPLALRKRLEVARALATGPRLLLLDELMGGLNPTEVNETLALIRSLHADGLTFLVIEHNMHAIMQIAETVWVLNQGRIIAQGPPAAVTRDPQVIAVYLGEPLEPA